MSYRHPNVLPECALDIMAGVAYLKHCRYQPVILVGHSFGGAVVIAAGALNEHVAGVVALAPQTYGAHLVGQLAPRPLLVVHGTADTRLPYSCGVQIYNWAHEPKQLVLYEGAEHRLEECAEELEQLLTQWIPATLRSGEPPAKVTVQVVTTGITPPLATSDRLQEAEKELLPHAEPRHTPR
jgi:pimeloyl-ACP methyl ester carboxylesterase